jgi:hypothetical protein
MQMLLLAAPGVLISTFFLGVVTKVGFTGFLSQSSFQTPWSLPLISFIYSLCKQSLLVVCGPSMLSKLQPY